MTNKQARTAEDTTAQSSASGLQLVRKEWSDSDLVAGLQCGDGEAAQILFAAQSQRINGLVWRLLGPDADHDDVVQQVYLNISQSITTLRDPSALTSWIIGLTFNTVKRELSRRGRRPTLVFTNDVPEEKSAGSDPDSRAVAAAFYGVLAGMGTQDRMVLVLRFVEGFELTDVAQACDCSLATIKRRLARARKRFRQRATGDFWLAPYCDRMKGDHDG